MSKYSTLIFVLAIGGCSKSHQPATYAVSGSVHFPDGKPMQGATVKFRMADRAPPFTASGKTDGQGVFHFSAVDGKNAVVVVPAFPSDTDDLTPAQRDKAMYPIDSVFLDFELSPLKVEVNTDSAKNQFELKIWPPRR